MSFALSYALRPPAALATAPSERKAPPQLCSATLRSVRSTVQSARVVWLPVASLGFMRKLNLCRVGRACFKRTSMGWNMDKIVDVMENGWKILDNGWQLCGRKRAEH